MSQQHNFKPAHLHLEPLPTPRRAAATTRTRCYSILCEGRRTKLEREVRIACSLPDLCADVQFSVEFAVLRVILKLQPVLVSSTLSVARSNYEYQYVYYTALLLLLL